MPTLLFANNVISTLPAELGSGVTSLTVATGDGALFPAPAVDEYFILTVTDNVAGTEEIMHCTDVTGDVLTVTRGEEGTSDIVLSADSQVAMHITAGLLEYLRDN